MSRSFKKTPICKDGSRFHRKSEKKIANRKARKYKGIQNGKFYRRIQNPWNIYDYVSYGGSLRSYLEKRLTGNHRLTPRKKTSIMEIIEDWEKWYYRK